jgi:hypothetical protein
MGVLAADPFLAYLRLCSIPENLDQVFFGSFQFRVEHSY